MMAHMTNASSLTIARLPTDNVTVFSSAFASWIRVLYLQHVNFTSATSMMSVLSKFQNLTSISLRHVNCLDGEVLETCQDIPSGFPVLARCKKVSWNPFAMYEDVDDDTLEHVRTATVLMTLIPHGITDLSVIAWNAHTHLVMLFIAQWGHTIIRLSLQIRGDGNWKLPSEHLGMSHSNVNEPLTHISSSGRAVQTQRAKLSSGVLLRKLGRRQDARSSIHGLPFAEYQRYQSANSGHWPLLRQMVERRSSEHMSR